MERENFFILLGLPFDPPVKDEARIKAAINAKQQEWARLHNSSETRSIALNYMELVPEIERVMLEDETARDEEADKAIKIREKVLPQFEGELRILEGKGYIMPRDIKELEDKYSSYGITYENIRSGISVPVTDTPPKKSEVFKAAKALDKNTVKLINSHLDVLGKENIYDFLGISTQADIKSLETSARNKHHDAFHSEDKSGKTSAAQLLTELIIELFFESGKRDEYDRYLDVSAYPELGELIDEENRRAGYISPEILLRLVNFGVTTYGENVLDIEEHIRSYCRAYGVEVDMVAPYITCPNCHKHSPRGTVFCEHCAAPLEGKCPKCGTFFSGGASVCSSCSFPLGDMGKAIPYVEQVENSLNDNNWSSAKHGLNYVQQYWPLHPRYEELKHRADVVEDRYYNTLDAIEEAVKGNRYYAAKELEERAEANNIKVPEDMKALIFDTIDEFNQKLSDLKEENNATYETLHSLLFMVSDSLELDRMLSQYPPAPPSRITARPAGDAVSVNWTSSPSSGNIEYILVRKEDSVSLTAYDGNILYEGDQNTFSDKHVPPLRNFFYSVFVKRGSSYSEMGAVAAAPVRIVPELKEFKIIPGEGAAQISWTPPAHLNSVKLWRKMDGEKPEVSGEGDFIQTDRLDGYTDMTLENDKNYWYYAVASYRTADGEDIDSKGIVGSVIPHKLVAPIEQFSISKVEDTDDIYLASWQGAPREEILIFSADAKPRHYLGQVLPTDELIYSYNRLQLDNQTLTNAKFRLSIEGGKYVFPVAVSGPFGTIGTPVYITNIPDVDNISYSIVDYDLFIKFDWPEDYNESVVVAWRRDRYPESFTQKNTEYVICSKEQYDIDSGVRIHDITRDSYYIKIYTEFSTPDGRKVYSDGAEYLVDNTPPDEFFYEIEYKKPLFSSKRKIKVKLFADQLFDFPKAVIIGKVGQVPLDISDGEHLFELRKETGISGPITFEYETGKLPKNMYMRLFFYDESEYRHLRPLPARSLIIT